MNHRANACLLLVHCTEIIVKVMAQNGAFASARASC
jgi:hypothetical protein